MRLPWILGVAVLAAACDDRAPAVPPLRLADTGLYADFAGGRIAADALPFAPQYPLWSDGAHKRRWIRLPAGSVIDNRAPDRWRFPAGTRLWKEFAFDRRVETRYMELGRDGEWSYATYLWSADGADAVLAPEPGVRGAYRDGDFRYDVPARADCRVCHEAGAGPVLGFTRLQLSVDRDPLAPHAEPPPPAALDLVTLQAAGLLAVPVDPAPRVVARSARERAALGYLHANCGSCHNERGPLGELGLVLEYCPDRDRPGALATACEQPSRFCPPGGQPGRTVRVHSGDPHRSVLMLRAGSRDPLLQMPPLGTRVVDATALDLLASWIREDLSRSTDNPMRQ